MGTQIAAGQDITPSFLNQYYGLCDTTTTIVTAAAQTQLSTPFTIPAFEPSVGSAYEIKCGGTASWPNPQQLLGFSFVLGSASLNNVAGIAAATFSVGATLRWQAVATIAYNTVGASGIFEASLVVTINEQANPINSATGPAAATNFAALTDAQGAMTTDTTQNQSAIIRAGWGGASGSPSITNRYTIFRKVA